MNASPALIVHARSPSARWETAPAPSELRSVIDAALQLGTDSGLPVVLVGSPVFAREAREVLPGNNVVELPDTLSPGELQDFTSQAVAAGVVASAQAGGWIVMPVEMSSISVGSVRAVAGALSRHAIVYPQYRHVRGPLVGFSCELFSELIRLRWHRDLARLSARYPSTDIEVEDPSLVSYPSLAIRKSHSSPSRSTDCF